MKFFKIFLVVAFSTFFSIMLFANDFVVFQKGKPCLIVFNSQSKEKIEKYAEELANWLKQITDTEFKINAVEDVKNVTGAIMVVSRNR